MTKLQERLRALIGDLAPRNHVPLATEAADALDAAEAEIARLKEERDRIERNRDMWKGQCERQAEQLSRTQLPAVAEDVVERLKQARRKGVGMTCSGSENDRQVYRYELHFQNIKDMHEFSAAMNAFYLPKEPV